MPTKQPSWKLIANIGDVNPLERGRLVYVDTTGVYSPELVSFDELAADSGRPLQKYEVRRICCDRCTMLANNPATISSNHYHADQAEWFADKLQSVADTYGMRLDELAGDLCGSDPVARAVAYDNLAGYFGGHEFDSYPVQMTAGELKRRYRSAFKR